MTSTTRLLIVQYAGDYRETVYRFQDGGTETYASQRYSVESVAALVPLVERVSVLVCNTDQAYNEQLPNGVYGIGAGFSHRFDHDYLLSLVAQESPTDLVLCTPNRILLRWAIRRNVRILGLLADSFRANSLRSRIRNWQLARLLNSPQVEWIANHNTNASRSLQSIGVNAHKIIPWDWVPKLTPEAFEPKKLQSGAVPTLFYAGAITENKGVGDLVRAIALLNQRGVRATAQFAGNGDIASFKGLAEARGVASQVTFLGMLSNDDVVARMRAADAVVIPSRHSYPEGLPMTIYEALCSRTPIIASDHPMFIGKLCDRQSALIFSASQPDALADCIKMLFRKPDLYQALSKKSAETWSTLQTPVKFGQLLKRWVTNQEEDRVWLQKHALASGLYDTIPA